MTSYTIAGGGIIGLTTAWTLLQRLGDVEVTVLEKESSVAAHQTGRNSGVVHSGLYYVPGSLKAELCREGKGLLESYCHTRNLPLETCGKVVVATSAEEIPRLDKLQARAEANGVPHERIGPERLRELEPHAFGIDALHVPVSGIVGYGAVCESLRAEIEASGRGSMRLAAKVRSISAPEGSQRAEIRLHGGETTHADHVINCTGLFSDRIARASGATPNARIVPFRGEYFRLTKGAEHLVQNLIYPVPDPRFPFLGVHFTRMVDGGIECGPNAVFALAREGYSWGKVSPRDLADALTWPGTWRLFAKHWRTGLGETWRSVSRKAFVKALSRLVPDIRPSHLEPIPAGVRAQALTRDGNLLDDFAVTSQGGVTHVINAPSPAATASFAIANHIVDVALGGQQRAKGL